MGLFDNFSLDNLDDPKNQGLLAMGLSMLAPKPYKTGLLGDIGSSGLTGLQTLVNAKTQERANRASDLQQLQGVYSILQNNEAMRWAAAKQSGQQYTPSPEYLAVQAKIAKMSGLNTLSSPGTPAPSVSSPLPPTNQTMPPPVPGVAPPSPSPMSNPGYQPVPGMVRPNSATPAPAYSPPPQASAQGSGFGAPAGGLDMTDYLMASMNPGFKMYAEQYAKDHSVQNVRSGGYILDANRNPVFYAAKLDSGIQPTFGQNGQVTAANAIPGYAPALSSIEAAKTNAVEGAKFPGRLENVQNAAGATVPMPATAIFGGNPFTGAVSPKMAAFNGTYTQPPPSVAKVTVTQPSQQASNGQQPADPWLTMPKRPVPQGIGQTTYDAKLDNLRAETASNLVAKYGGAAATANDRKALNNQALDLVDQADTGMGGALIGDVKNFLVSRAGIPASDFSNDPNATVALNKDLMQAAVAKAKAAFGQRMSTNEVNNMLKRGAPNGDMMKGAIKFLLQLDNVKADYEIQQSHDLGRYITQNGDPLQFDGWYPVAFPLHNKMDGFQLAPNVGNSTAPAAGWSVKRVK